MLVLKNPGYFRTTSFLTFPDPRHLFVSEGCTGSLPVLRLAHQDAAQFLGHAHHTYFDRHFLGSNSQK